MTRWSFTGRCCATLAFAAIVAWGCAPLHAQLSGYWTFDGDALDSSGVGNNAVLNGDAGFNASVPAAIGSGMSLSLDGDGDYASVAAHSSLNSQTFTLSYWVNQNGAVQNGGFERTTSRGGDSFETAIASNNTLNYWRSPPWVNTGQTVPGSGWSHVAWVNDGSMRLYVDGTQVFSGGPAGSPSGLMHIGARHNGAEGFEGLLDNVSLFGNTLAPSAIGRLASGTNAPTDFSITTVTSEPGDWSLSTVRTTGGPNGTWVPGPLPSLDGTFTEAATGPAIANIATAGTDLGVATISAGGAGNAAIPEGVQYYRTTFELENFESVSATLVSAFDNGGQIFINGTELARETSFLVENWASPYSSLTVDEDGTVSNVTLFDANAASFDNWLVGTNELIVAVRNPDGDSLTGGGFALRLDVATIAAIPEPTSVAIWSLLGLSMAGFTLWRRRRKSTDR